MVDTFNTQNNKEFMWNLMYENDMFADISSTKVNLVKTTFDELVENIESSSSHLPLSEKNKQVLLQMNKKRANFMEEKLPITSDEMKNRRSEHLNNKFIEQQKSLEHTINAPRPKEIDFSDNSDRPIGSEMDNMIAQVIEKRKNELNIAFKNQDTTKGGEWINKDNPPHSKIGEETVLTDKIIQKVENKSENFDTPQTKADNDDNFLSLLKPVEEEQDINTRLSVIERNQSKILDMLGKILILTKMQIN